MSRRFGWVAAVVVAVIALSVGAVIYNIGLSHGLSMAAPAAGAPAAGAVPYAPYMWHRPWGFGFGFGPVFLLLLFFLVFRPLLWGGFYGRRSAHGHPYDVPPRFEEWHRRAHDRMNSPNPPASVQPDNRA